MEINDTRHGQYLIISPVGELNFDSSDTFSQHCLALVEKGEKNIVLDFSKLRYLSSAGLRSILVLDRRLREKSGTLALCAPSEAAQMVLQMSGLLNQYKVYASTEELPGV